MEQIENLKNQFQSRIEEIKEEKELEELRVEYLGKKSPITELSKTMKDLSDSEKRSFGPKLNELKQELTSKINEKRNSLNEELLARRLVDESIDVTLPASKIEFGTTHPLSKTINTVKEIFVSMGYDVVTGPEMELDYFNFEMLNLPKGHPARDTQDSFYITEERLLRTQTSPVQARTMQANKDKGPIRVICPGKTYRRDDDDATHSHQFHQIEGLVIDKDISMAHLKGTLEVLVKELFGNDRKIRFRPDFFPFTEPSFEVDVTCFKCNGKGCSLCKGTGWIEILGSGMVHPNVLKYNGYDPELYTGFAFGMGAERIAMLKYGINDVRDFYTNDVRFLLQFGRTEGSVKNED